MLWDLRRFILAPKRRAAQLGVTRTSSTFCEAEKLLLGEAILVDILELEASERGMTVVPLTVDSPVQILFTLNIYTLSSVHRRGTKT